MHVCGCIHEPASINPNAGGLQGWESSGFVHMCSLGSQLPRGPEWVSGHLLWPSCLWLVGEALGGPEEGRTYTDHLPCMQVPASPVMTPSSSWPCALATLVRESATPTGRRGNPGVSPPLYASHWPMSPCSDPWDHPQDCPPQESVITGSCLCPPPDCCCSR